MYTRLTKKEQIFTNHSHIRSTFSWEMGVAELSQKAFSFKWQEPF